MNGRRWGEVTGALAAFVIVGALSAYLHAASPPGRRAIAEGISRGISAAIAGELSVEGVRSAWLPELSVERLRVRDPDGRVVLLLRDIEVRLDLLGCLLDRGFHATHARVGGGEVRVIGSSGQTGIERAFASPETPGAGSADAGEDPAARERAPTARRVLDVREVELGDVRVALAMPRPRLHFHVREGEGRMWLREGDDFQGRFTHLSGRLTADAAPIPDASFDGVRLAIDPGANATVRFAGRAHALGDRVTVVGHAPPSDGDGVRLCLYTPQPSIASLVGVLAEVGDSIGSALSLDVRFTEPPSPPTCEER